MTRSRHPSRADAAEDPKLLAKERKKQIGNEGLREPFVRPLYLARRVLEQERRQRGRKVYSLQWLKAGVDELAPFGRYVVAILD